MLLFQLLLAVSIPTFVSAAFHHSLRYLYTSVLGGEDRAPRFMVIGYVDDTQFMYHDGDGRIRTLQPWARGNDIWTGWIQTFRSTEQMFRAAWSVLIMYYNHSTHVTHTFQWYCGCDTLDGGFGGGK